MQSQLFDFANADPAEPRVARIEQEVFLLRQDRRRYGESRRLTPRQPAARGSFIGEHDIGAFPHAPQPQHFLRFVSPTGGYQITTRLSPAFTIGSVSLQPNAAANGGRFAGAPLARTCAGECGSDTSRTFAASGRVLERHAAAQP